MGGLRSARQPQTCEASFQRQLACAADAEPRPFGFEATSGWDPVSGLGSITYANLASLFPRSYATDGGDGVMRALLGVSPCMLSVTRPYRFGLRMDPAVPGLLGK